MHAYTHARLPNITHAHLSEISHVSASRPHPLTAQSVSLSTNEIAPDQDRGEKDCGFDPGLFLLVGEGEGGDNDAVCVRERAPLLLRVP